MTVTINDYQTLLSAVNFVGGAGKGDLSTVSGELNQRADIGVDGDGDYQFYYYELTSLADLNALGYYTSGVDREYTQLPSGGPALSVTQTTMLASVLSPSAWGGSFSDVAKIDFNAGDTTNADIVIGATTNGGTPSIDSTVGAYELDYNAGWSALKHGDIWLNNDASLVWDVSGVGTTSHFAIMHEISHSLGWDVLDNNGVPLDTDLDSQKYTVTSYNFLDGMLIADGLPNEVLPSGLQLLDIAAVQAIYGENWDTRNEDNTQYSKTTAFASTRLNEAFIYTIWDGGGTGDAIDASGYDIAATIDLNEGAFSSIGYNAEGTAAIDNVAIAYKAEIENAIGTFRNDTLIGNALDNMLTGGSGKDTITGGLGNDILDGGNHSDTYIFNLGDGNDEIIDRWDSQNTFEFGAGISFADIDYEMQGNDLIVHYSDLDSFSLVDFFVDQEDIFETITNDSSETMHLVSDSTTTIYATPEDEIIFGNSANNIIYHYAGDDTVFAGTGDDRILGGDGDDSLYGEDGNDTIYGGYGNDILYGNDGDDYLGDSLGTNEFYGGNGSDTYDFSAGDNIHQIQRVTDSGGTDDTLFLQSIHIDNIDDVTLSGNSSGSLVVNFDAYNPPHAPLVQDTIIVQNYFSSSDTIEWLKIKGYDNGHFTQTFSLFSLTDGFILGSDTQDDLLNGDASDNRVYGFAGNDTIYAGFGNDTLIGGTGDDTLDGGSGVDVVDYSSSTAGVTVNIQSGTADDGMGGTDTLVSIENIIGSEYADVLVGNNLLENELWGLGGNDNLQGRGAQDIMHGGDGTDTIRGGDDDDILYGGADTDYLYGNADDDYLDGGAGVDALWGHAGADTFAFNAADAFTGSDNIKDFSLTDGDMLDISDLLQGYDPLNDLITDFVEITDNGTHSYLKVDVDGGADNFVQVAQISAMIGLTDEVALETGGTLITV